MDKELPEIIKETNEPIMPDWVVGEVAQKHWKKLIRDIRVTRTLHPADGEQIAIACEAWEWYLACKKQVTMPPEDGGGMFFSAQSGYNCPTAAFTGMQNWLKIYQNSLGKLGLNAPARKGVKLNEAGAKQASTGRKTKTVSRFAITKD